jgi:hypothetical protein
MFFAGTIASSVWQDTWVEPSQQFEEWVKECALQSLTDHCNSDSLNGLTPEEAVRIYRKALRVVVDNEQKVRRGIMTLSCALVEQKFPPQSPP